MRAPIFAVAAIVVAAILALATGRGAPAAPGALVASAPDGVRLAVATAGARNVRVLYVSGGGIVRLREVFVPEGEAIEGIAWSDEGRNVIVTTQGRVFAVDTTTWRLETGTARAAGDAARRTRG